MGKESVKFEMICTGGPFGDACSSYDVRIDGRCTVGEFVESVLKEKPGEWGTFDIVRDLKYLNSVDVCEYERGEVKKDFKKAESRGLEVKEIKAHGGWTLMEYYIKAKAEK